MGEVPTRRIGARSVVRAILAQYELVVLVQCGEAVGRQALDGERAGDTGLGVVLVGFVVEVLVLGTGGDGGVDLALSSDAGFPGAFESIAARRSSRRTLRGALPIQRKRAGANSLDGRTTVLLVGTLLQASTTLGELPCHFPANRLSHSESSTAGLLRSSANALARRCANSAFSSPSHEYLTPHASLKANSPASVWAITERTSRLGSNAYAFQPEASDRTSRRLYAPLDLTTRFLERR